MGEGKKTDGSVPLEEAKDDEETDQAGRQALPGTLKRRTTIMMAPGLMSREYILYWEHLLHPNEAIRTRIRIYVCFSAHFGYKADVFIHFSKAVKGPVCV